jgi:hypothetical protein
MGPIQRVPGRDRGRLRTVHARQLLDGNDVRHVVHVRAAVLGGNEAAEQTQLPHLPGQLHGELLALVEGLGHRRDLVLGEIPDRLPQQVLLLGEIKIRTSPPVVGRIGDPIRRKAGGERNLLPTGRG